MKLNEKEIFAVSKLPAKSRYEYFVKKIVDFELAWGLFDGGWALSEDSNGKKYFPLWPAKEYANRCAIGDWKSYSAKEIPLDELREILFPQLELDEIQINVFMSYVSENAVVTPNQLQVDIEIEMEKY